MNHDPFLATAIETLGRERTIIALQNYAAQAFRNHQASKRMRIDFATQSWFNNASWAYRNARILQGIEE